MIKNEPIRVISQMTTSRARPIELEPPPVYFSAFPTGHPEFPSLARGEFKSGRIYHRFFSAQACSCILLFVSRGSAPFRTTSFSLARKNLYRIQLTFDEFF